MTPSRSETHRGSCLGWIAIFATVLMGAGAVVVWGLNPWFIESCSGFVAGCMAVAIPLGWGMSRLRAGPRRVRRWVAVAIGSGLMVVLRPQPAPIHPSLIIVGLDGATWDVIDTIGLPNIERLKARGQWGVLRATPPLFSPLLWTTMATGKLPEAHGIRGFRVRADQAIAARFWEVARDAGLQVGLYKWLVTWPPPGEQMDGFVVPAWLAPDPTTHPEHLSWVKELELSRRLARRRVTARRSMTRLALTGIGDGLRLSSLLRGVGTVIETRLGHADQDVDQQMLRMRIDRDVFIAQMHRHPSDLLSLSLYAIDAIGHSHWSGPDGGSVVGDAYRLADQILGEVLDQVGDQTAILLVSDHGFRASSPADRLRNFVPTTVRLEALMRAAVGEVEVARMGRKLTATWLGMDPQAGQAAMAQWLSTLVRDSTGEPLYRWESVPGSPRALGLTLGDERVDPLTIETERVGEHPLTDFIRIAPGQAGEHAAEGIVVLAGPTISPLQLDGVDQLAITPTILSLLGLPAAEDMSVPSLDAEAIARE